MRQTKRRSTCPAECCGKVAAVEEPGSAQGIGASLATRAVWLRLHSSLAMKLTSTGPGWYECACVDLRDTACCRLRPTDDAYGSSDRAMARMIDGRLWAWDSGKVIEPICHLLRVAGDISAEVAQLTRVGERGPGFSID